MSYGKARKVRERFSARRRFDECLIDDYFDSGNDEPPPRRPVRIVFDAPRLSEVAYQGGREPLFDEMLPAGEDLAKHVPTSADRAVAALTTAAQDSAKAAGDPTQVVQADLTVRSPRVPVRSEDREDRSTVSEDASASPANKPVLRMPLKIHRPSRSRGGRSTFSWLRFSMSIIAGTTAAIFILGVIKRL